MWTRSRSKIMTAWQSEGIENINKETIDFILKKMKESWITIEDLHKKIENNNKEDLQSLENLEKQHVISFFVDYWIGKWKDEGNINFHKLNDTSTEDLIKYKSFYQSMEDFELWRITAEAFEEKFKKLFPNVDPDDQVLPSFIKNNKTESFKDVMNKPLNEEITKKIDKVNAD